MILAETKRRNLFAAFVLTKLHNMNPILKQIFAEGVCRYYPYEIGNRLVVRVFQSFVIYYLEKTPNSTDLSFITTDKDGLKCFEFNGHLLPLCYSIPYDGLKHQVNVK